MIALLVDDEPNARTLLKEYIADLGYDFEVLEAENAYSAREILDAHPVDILFLDIGLPEKSGMEMILEKRTSAHVIFTTAYQEFAVQAFEIHAVDYLLKPFGKERFKDAVERVLQHEKQDLQTIVRQTLQQIQSTGKYLERISVRSGGALAIIKVDDIAAIEASLDYCNIVKNDGRTFLDAHKMHYFEKFLNPAQFVRIHRSTIINLDYIASAKRDGSERLTVKMQNGKRYTASRAGWKKLKNIGAE